MTPVTGPTIVDPEVASAVARMGEGYMPVTCGTPDPAPGEHWWRFADAAGDEAITDALTQMPADYDDDVAVATAFLCSRLMSPLAMLTGRGLVADGRGLLLDPERLWLRRHPRGWHNAVAIDPPRLIVGASDPLAGRAGVTVVRDGGAVRRAAVESMLGLAAPLVERLRRHGQLGERALWGQLADMLVTAAARVHDPVGDADAATCGAQEILDLDERLWVTPNIHRVEVDGAVGLAWRRGSCCLAYRVDRFDLCTGCPLTDEATWWDRSVASVRERAGGHE